MCDTASAVSSEGESKKRPLQDIDTTDSKKQCTEPDRVKKRKVALLLAYSGQGYLGMQRNPGMKTIEEDLLTALLKASFITEEAFNTPQLIQFQRAARTDKGVSAARQVVSIKLPEDSKVEMINNHLPEQIHVLAVKRATKGFNSKSSCDARTYSYILPTFAFAPSNVEPSESYRITSEVMDSVRSTLKIFEGTHNFHNFTARKKPLDPSANRYIMSFEMGEPFICKGLEFSELRVKGQSFMLHQIRKMVGLTIAVARGLASVHTIHRAWKTERLDLPVAPGLGLILEEVHYERYNQRFGKDGIHEPLDWSEVEAEVTAFKENFIYPTITESEVEEKSMMTWLETLHLHSYSIREDNLSHGLATLGQAADMVEGMGDGDHGLVTLARAAAQVVQEGHNVMYNGDSNQQPSPNIPSP
ncbi:tRNA pseudouridine synthase A isoform X2 [Cryptotermes secundus]|nr:tRNA pseudouridine synthase A isoform X2 [Cryptotermes secundus]XP_023723377.1 tRNA pseudouridine synthase A isoform X2 [Cryptotermes secundus]